MKNLSAFKISLEGDRDLFRKKLKVNFIGGTIKCAQNLPHHSLCTYISIYKTTIEQIKRIVVENIFPLYIFRARYPIIKVSISKLLLRSKPSNRLSDDILISTEEQHYPALPIVYNTVISN